MSQVSEKAKLKFIQAMNTSKTVFITVMLVALVLLVLTAPLHVVRAAVSQDETVKETLGSILACTRLMLWCIKKRLQYSVPKF